MVDLSDYEVQSLGHTVVDDTKESKTKLQGRIRTSDPEGGEGTSACSPVSSDT